MTRETVYAGFDIGGTKCAVVLCNESGEDQSPCILAKEVFSTRSNPSPDGMLQQLIRSARTLTAQTGPGNLRLVAAGVSCGGPLDTRRGRVLSPPNLPGWDDVPVVEILQSALGVPVRLQNDANACALAEWRWGAARGADDAVFLTFGTGMGAGLILNGRLHEGKDDLAGEVGHWRLAPEGPLGFGKHGSLEGFCSGGGMARLARRKIRETWARGETSPYYPDEDALAALDVKILASAARQGDPIGGEVFRLTAEKLGEGLSLLIDLLNPEVIVIGSIFARCEDLLRGPMRDVVERETLPAAGRRVRIVPAALGEAIGDYAALAVARSASATESSTC